MVYSFTKHCPRFWARQARQVPEFRRLGDLRGLGVFLFYSCCLHVQYKASQTWLLSVLGCREGKVRTRSSNIKSQTKLHSTLSRTDISRSSRGNKMVKNLSLPCLCVEILTKGIIPFGMFSKLTFPECCYVPGAILGAKGIQQ